MPLFRTGQPIARQFKRLNGLNARTDAASQEVINLRHRTEGGRAQFVADVYHPFKLYQLPIEYRDTPDANTDWRRFVVRAGRVFESDATGTDLEDTNPDAETIGAADNEILVPNATPKFWFWLELGADAYGVTTAVVRYSATPNANAYTDGINPSWTSDAPWSGAPKPDRSHVPIAWVDTDTDNAVHVAHVRQLLRADVMTVGGSGMTFRGEWTDSLTYGIDDLVIWSSSGPQMGAYVATLDGRDATTPPWEGNGWAKLPNGMGPWI
jgi:hypothetical protein